jgi:hypothetical protein
MPVRSCQANRKPGFKWGSGGKCYTYTQGNEASRRAAISKAERQGRVIEANRDKK